MTQLSAKGFVAIVVCCCALSRFAHAADPLPAETRLVTAAGAAAPTQLAFNIPAAQDLAVTLTDLQVPAALVSAGIVVTQAAAIAATARLATPATSATLFLPAAVGDYTLYVFGVPNPGYSVGTFTVCVAPKSDPSNCIQSASLSGNITAQSTANDPTISTLSANFNVTTPGSYTFSYADLNFPVALQTSPNLALFRGSTPVQLGIPPGTALSLNAGVYTLLAIAQADQTAGSGLYGVTIAGPAGTPSPFDAAIPVGLAKAAAPFNNPVAQLVTLKVSDYGFPAPLASASAMLTAGGSVLGTASAAGGAANFMAPAGGLELWTFGSAAASAGTFSADVSAGASDLYTAAQGVGSSGTNYAYAFVTPPLAAGAYQATAADLQFPSQLSGLSFAVAQDGVILQQSADAATVNISAAAGNVVVLVGAQTPSSGSVSGNGLFDVNLQTSGAAPQLVFDKTQSVSSSAALFDSQTINLGVNSSFDASLSDLAFPAQFSNLALVVSRGAQILGKIYGGGTFSFPATTGSYQLTFVATPSAAQQVGLYGVSILYSPPSVTLASSVTSAAAGSPIQLNWTATNADGCTASGGSWTGDKAASSGNDTVILTETTTYTLTCTGMGGMKSQSVTVTATAKQSSSSGGGAIDVWTLAIGSALLSARAIQGRRLRRSAAKQPRPLSINHAAAGRGTGATLVLKVRNAL